MAEIVRVLKWRLDLDAAGLTTGLDSATTKAKAFGDEAQRSGDRGAVGLKKTAVAAKETDTAFEGLGFEAQQVEMYVSRLEKGSGSPLVLKRNAELAEAAFNVLAASAQKVGQAIPEAFSDRLIGAIGQATTQAAGMNAELEKMGGQTPTKLDKVITALEKTQSSLAGMGEAGRTATAAMADLEKAGDSPGKLQRSAALASIALGTLKDKIAEAAAEGKQFGPEVASGVANMERAIDGAVTKAATMREELSNLSKQGNATVQGFDTVRGGVTSMAGAFEVAKASGNELAGKLANVGLAAEALYKTGMATYDWTRAGIEKMKDYGINLDDSVDKSLNAAKAYLGMNSSIEESVRLFSALPGPVNASLRALQAHDVATQQAATALGKLGIAWRDASETTATTKEAIGQLDKLLVNVKKSGDDWEQTVTLNASSIRALDGRVKEARISMEELPPAVREAIEAIGKMDAAASAAKTGMAGLAQATDAAAQAALRLAEQTARDAAGDQKWAAEQTEQREKQTEQREKQVEREKGFMKEYLASGEEYMAFEEKRRQSLRETNEAEAAAAEALWDHTNTLDAYNAAIRENTEAWKAGLVQLQAVNWEIRHATKQTFELSDAQKLLVEELAKVSDQFGVASTWVGHFIAQLEDDMAKGNVSLDDFRAKVERIIAALGQINAAGSNWMGDLQAELLMITRLLNDFEDASKKAAG